MMYIISIYGSKELLEQVETCSMIKTTSATITLPGGSKINSKIEFVFAERNHDLAKAKFSELSKRLNELATVPCKNLYKDITGTGLVAKYYLADNSAFVTFTQYNTV